MKINRILISLLVMIIVLSVSICLAANVKVQINGNIIDFTDSEGNKVEAQTINSRTMVPLRKIFEVLGCEINWEGKTKTVTAKRNDKTIVLTVGNNKATIQDENGESIIDLDSPPTIIDNRTLVPLRFIGESLGNEVAWDKNNATAIILNYDEIANMIKEKCSFLFNHICDANSVSFEEKYFDEADSNRNQTTTFLFTSEKLSDNKDKISISISGNSDFANESKTEEWNNFSYDIIDNRILTNNYVLSKMLYITKNESSKVNYDYIGLSKENANNISEWIKMVSNIDNSSININTYKELKDDWNKLLNTFLNSKNDLTTNDFSYKHINLNNILKTRCSKAIDAFLTILKFCYNSNIDFQDMLVDYPKVDYIFSKGDNSIKIVIKLKNEYKERREYTFTVSI